MIPVIKTILDTVPYTNLSHQDMIKLERGEEILTYSVYTQNPDNVARILDSRKYKCLENIVETNGRRFLHFKSVKQNAEVYIYES
jgi:NAD-dependent SIR2 family protein deacetylase